MAYTPRLTAPAQTDPLWVMVEAGGYNGCIAGWWPGGYSAYPCVLPNCTGYVHGRAMEIAGVTSDNLGLSFGNAYDYWSQTSADWIRESEPSLGAIGVFGQQSSGDYPGHVYVVEEIIDADTIVVSESDYGMTYFATHTVTRSNGWDPYGQQYVYFMGFLKNPYVTPEPQPTRSKNVILLLAALKKKRRLYGRLKRHTVII